MMDTEQRGACSESMLGDPATRPGIAGTAYDTAWLAGVCEQPGLETPAFPTSLQWLVEHQHTDGSWGGEVRYQHDRILCTLAALAPLASFGRRERDRECVAAGVRYLWQHGHLLKGEPMELVGFELLVPALVQRARQAGIVVPPHLDVYADARAEKFRLLMGPGLYSPRVTVVHSLEFLGAHADGERLREVQGSNGAVGNSPAATAFFFSQTHDLRAKAYLTACLSRTGGAMAPVLHPCETFELLWSAYHLFLAGVPASRLLQPSDREDLRAELRAGGVSLSPSFPIPDADDTAVAMLLLHDFGDQMDPGQLQAFASGGSDHFVSFPFERHSSVGVNLHVLHALLRIPGYPNRDRVIQALLDYLLDQQIGGIYWLDKWHISPFYATAHALCILRELPPHLAQARPALDRAREWLQETQNADGSWGHYGQATAEETAYALLALATDTTATQNDLDQLRCLKAAQYLRATRRASAAEGDAYLPPLWIDKCLYAPTLVIQTAIEAALVAQARFSRGISHQWTITAERSMALLP